MDYSNLPQPVQETQVSSPAGSLDARSLQESLSHAIGRFVICKSLVGTNNISTMSGILNAVGNSYYVLMDPCTKVETTCDIFSLKYISVYPEGIPDYQLYCKRRLYELSSSL